MIDVERQLTNCLQIISAWEGGTLYAHGNGAVGLLGFQFGRRTKLLEMMGLPADTTDADFDVHVGRDKVMAKTQQTKLGIEVLREIYDYSCKPRGLKSFTSVVQVLDIGINNGRQNSMLTRAEHELGWMGKAKVKDEQRFARQVAKVRIKEIGHLFQQYPGLKVRYDWYKERADKWDIPKEWPDIRIEPKGRTITMIQ